MEAGFDSRTRKQVVVIRGGKSLSPKHLIINGLEQNHQKTSGMVPGFKRGL